MLKVHHCAIPKIQNNDTETDRQTDRDTHRDRDREREEEEEDEEEEEEPDLMPWVNRHIDLKHQKTFRAMTMKTMKSILLTHSTTRC